MSDLRADLARARELLDQAPAFEPLTWTVPPGTCTVLVGGVPCLHRQPCPDHDPVVPVQACGHSVYSVAKISGVGVVCTECDGWEQADDLGPVSVFRRKADR